LKKVKITKTKTSTKNRPKKVPEISLQEEDMMLQNAHGPVPCYLAPEKEKIPWLCTSIASP